MLKWYFPSASLYRDYSSQFHCLLRAGFPGLFSQQSNIDIVGGPCLADALGNLLDLQTLDKEDAGVLELLCSTVLSQKGDFSYIKMLMFQIALDISKNIKQLLYLENCISP